MEYKQDLVFTVVVVVVVLWMLFRCFCVLQHKSAVYCVASSGFCVCVCVFVVCNIMLFVCLFCCCFLDCNAFLFVILPGGVEDYVCFFFPLFSIRAHNVTRMMLCHC